MSKARFILLIPAVLAVWISASASLRADVIETKDGSRIVGKLTKINAGKLYVSTAAAGDIAISQSEVVSVTTDHPLSVRLQSGTRVDGTLATTPAGATQIIGQEGTLTTKLPNVSQSWGVGSLDPAAAHWAYEASVDINGTSGNKTQLGTEGGFSAKRIAPSDELDFYTAYNRQVTEGTVSADQFKAGIDYANNFSTRTSWFLRDEAGFDKVMDITLYETAALGIGQDLVKTKFDTLTGRVGLAYRYDGYATPGTPAVSSAAADFELNHDFKTTFVEVGNKLTLVPAFNDFKNYVITQDSFLQIPMANPAWKLRIGLANNYESLPPAGFKKLDSTFYTRLILDWGQ